MRKKEWVRGCHVILCNSWEIMLILFSIFLQRIWQEHSWIWYEDEDLLSHLSATHHVLTNNFLSYKLKFYVVFLKKKMCQDIINRDRILYTKWDIKSSSLIWTHLKGGFHSILLLSLNILCLEVNNKSLLFLLHPFEFWIILWVLLYLNIKFQISYLIVYIFIFFTLFYFLFIYLFQEHRFLFLFMFTKSYPCSFDRKETLIKGKSAYRHPKL